LDTKAVGSPVKSPSRDDQTISRVEIALEEIWQLNQTRLAQYIRNLCAIDREAFGGDAWVEENFVRMLPSKFVISRIAVSEGEPAGYLIGSKYGLNYAHIHRFAVLARFRKKGLGKKLLLSFEDACLRTGVTKITLESFLNRFEANSLYEQMEFRKLTGSELEDYLHLKGRDTPEGRGSGLPQVGTVLVYQKTLTST
jgi:ribosomal-protein-alanine N-acetyltransferase